MYYLVRLIGLLALAFHPSMLIIAQRVDSSPLKPAIVAGDLVQARTDVYNHVGDLKRKFASKAQAGQLIQGKRLYDKALGSYKNWITTLHLAIQDGTIKSLRNDPDYKAKTLAAEKASGEFINYAEIDGSKGVFVFASDAATIGIKIWNAIKDRQKQERTEFLVEFDKIVKWDDWDIVGAAPEASGKSNSTNGKSPSEPQTNSKQKD